MNNKKIHVKNIIVLIVIIILIVVGITITMSRYRSDAETIASADVAFFVVKDTYQSTGNIFLENLYPREDPFEYLITVANSDGTNTAQITTEYTLEMEITTNLPLEFNIYKDNTKLTAVEDIENTVVLDSTQESYVRKIKIKNGKLEYGQYKLDKYKIEVIFPVKYVTYEEFEGMIDNINIKIDANQKVDDEKPTISLSAQENETALSSHSVTVTIADSNGGLATGAELQYGWSTSLETEPTQWENITLTNYALGTKITTFKAQGTGLNGQYYLWVKPITVKDVAGNTQTETTKSTGTFNFDNTQ